eukprot:112236-Prymnesium_polylepis.1
MRFWPSRSGVPSVAWRHRLRIFRCHPRSVPLLEEGAREDEQRVLRLDADQRATRCVLTLRLTERSVLKQIIVELDGELATIRLVGDLNEKATIGCAFDGICERGRADYDSSGVDGCLLRAASNLDLHIRSVQERAPCHAHAQLHLDIADAVVFRVAQRVAEWWIPGREGAALAIPRHCL